MRMGFLKTIGYLFIVISLFISCEISKTIEPTPEPVYYIVTFNSDGGSSVESQRIEKGKTAVKPTNPIKEGYTFSNWYNGNSLFDFSTPINSDITLKASWSKNLTEEGNSNNDESGEENNTESGEISENKKVYTIIFNINDGSDNPITKTQSIEEGKASLLTTTVSLAFTRAGYVFSEWNTAQNGSGTKYSDGAEITLNSNLTLFAQWTAGNGTHYTVKHYQQNITDDNYTLIENDTQILTGKTGSSTNANSKTYEGFTAQTFEQKDIAADGNTTIEIYYNRNIITLTFSANGGTWSDGTTNDKTLTGKYGAVVNMPDLPTLTDYKGNWDQEIQTTFSENKNYSVVWMEKTKAAYKVTYMLQTLDGNGYYGRQSDTFYGNVGEYTNAQPKEIEGFVLSPSYSLTQKIITEDGKTSVWIYYDRITVTLTFIANGGKWEDGTAYDIKLSGKYGAKVVYNKVTGQQIPLLLEKEGYETIFDKTVQTTFTNNETYTASYNSIIASYRVNHWQQNITDDNYTLFETETLTGIVGSKTQASRKSYTGFTMPTENPNYNKTVSKNGTVINIYYKRKIITLTFSTNGGTWSDGTVGDKIFKDRYGASFSIELPTKTGYKASWNEQIQNKFTIDKTYSVEWTQLSINYTVEHYQENADDDNYTLYQTETLTGLYNSTTSAESKNYDGFTAKSFEQISIVDNTVVKIYYARKRFSLIFEKNDGSSDKVVVSAKQGAKVINYAPKFSRPYYELDWNIATSKLVTQDETFIAQWTGWEVTLVFCANYEPCSYPTNYQIFRNGEAKTIQKDLFLRSGYTLRGWTTQKNSNVIAYENEATITYHISSEEPSVFYAVWQKNLTVEATQATSSITGISDAGLYLIKITGTITTAIKEEINAAIASSSATIELDLSECQIVDWQFGEPIDAEYAAGVIGTITETGTYTLKIIGILSSSAMSEIADVIKTREGTIELDISETTGLQALPKNCFKDCKNIKTIVLPNGITTVGASCFENCNSLSSVNLPVSVTKIEAHAFDKCFSITDIEIPQNVTYIGYSAFAETGISQIVIPNGVSLLPAGVFSNCKNLASITLPETLTQIGGGSWIGGGSCDGAFANCTSLTQIELPSSLKTLGGYTFYGCDSLTQIELPSSLKTLGAYTFYGCDSLTSINLDKITSFGENALCGTKISSITLSSEITIISDEAFSYLTALTSINIPDGVTRIGKGAFEGCSKLSSITIPDSVTYIGGWAFAETAIQTISLPSGLTELYGGMFYDCKNLQYITIPFKVEILLPNVFYGSSISSVVFENKTNWEYCDYNGTVEAIDVSSEVYNANQLRSYDWATNGIRLRRQQ